MSDHPLNTGQNSLPIGSGLKELTFISQLKTKVQKLNYSNGSVILLSGVQIDILCLHLPPPPPTLYLKSPRAGMQQWGDLNTECLKADWLVNGPVFK